MASGQNETLLVAAIDFGTTFSGYAFSFNSEYQKDPLKISANQSWISGGQGLISLKTSTTVLLRPDTTFDSFGFEAESKYAELAEDDEHHDWFYFRHFKMKLFNNKMLSRNLTIDDDQGRAMSAKTVFSLSIRYLKDHLLKRLKEGTTSLTLGDIQWVLTIPAIWDDSAKQFMREAAVEAGVEDSKLMLALEPEAAAIYCKEIAVQKKQGAEGPSLSAFDPGSKFMVLDLGGGTVDTTVHEVLPGGKLKELHKASGGAWGGTKVDGAYLQLLTKIVGGDVLQKFAKEHRADKLEMDREFEAKKRTVTPETNGKVSIRFPVALIELYEQIVHEKMSDTLKNSTLSSHVEVKSDKCRIKADIVKDLFQECSGNIVKHVNDLLGKTPDVTTMLMVGGFSESSLVKEAVQKAFPHKEILIPSEAGLAVLKGAVMFGHEPRAICYRVCKYTYGIIVNGPFDGRIHPENKKSIFDGVERCSGIFHIFVREGQTVNVGETSVEDTFSPPTATATAIHIGVYASSDHSPVFVTDPGCRKLGSMIVHMQDTNFGVYRPVKIHMFFGGTEIHVKATEIRTGFVTKASVNFLG